MIPRLKPDLRLGDLTALLPSGDAAADVRRFEDAFTALAGQGHAIAFPMGRTALIGLLRALDRPGGEVICPSYTCVVVPHAIVKAGMRPVFVDSSPDDFNMDWTFVDAATGAATAAVIATSIFGHPVNGADFRDYRAGHSEMTILQDCAHGFFAGDSHKDGLAAFYGLNISKIITSVFGGMVTTDDAGFAARLRILRDEMVTPRRLTVSLRRSVYLMAVFVAFSRPVYGLVNRLEGMRLLDRFVKYYDPAIIDLPTDAFTAMGGLEARLGLRQCLRYHEIVAHRRQIAAIYHKRLTGVGDLILPPIDPGMTVSHFVVRTHEAERIKRACLSKGVQLGALIDYEIADMPAYRDAKYLGERRSRAYPSQVINLPVHMGVQPGDAERICEAIGSAGGATPL